MRPSSSSSTDDRRDFVLMNEHEEPIRNVREFIYEKEFTLASRIFMIKHPNILRAENWTRKNDKTHVYYEFDTLYMQFHEFLKKEREKLLEMDHGNLRIVGFSQVMRTLVSDIMKAITGVHNNGLFHGSISMDNFLVFKEGEEFVLRLAYLPLTEKNKAIDVLSKDVSDGQKEDIMRIGDILRDVCIHLHRKLGYTKELAHFADYLFDCEDIKNINNYMYHTFFWDHGKRHIFYVWAGIKTANITEAAYRLIDKELYAHPWKVSLVNRMFNSMCKKTYVGSSKGFTDFMRDSLSHPENLYKGADSSTVEKYTRARYPEFLPIAVSTLANVNMLPSHIPSPNF